MYLNISFLLFYALSCGFLYLLYPLIGYVFEKYSFNYRNINPKHKKKYFNSNFIKGFVLSICAYESIYILYDYFINGYWNINKIKYIGAVYASLDMVSMFMVPKMQINTVIHHTLVQILYFISLHLYNFDSQTLSNGIVIYAIFSSYAFIVNMYLALRLIINEEYLLRALASVSSIVYQICCCLNWIYQLYFIYSFSSISIIIRTFYAIILSLIIFDDIVLIKFLNKNSYLN